jgi:hypothetical protein
MYFSPIKLKESRNFEGYTGTTPLSHLELGWGITYRLVEHLARNHIKHAANVMVPYDLNEVYGVKKISNPLPIKYIYIIF